jgi:diguanylate cyclase (GGDEF)-like protein
MGTLRRHGRLPGWVWRLSTAGLAAATFLAAGRALALDPSRLMTQYVLDAWEDELPQASVHAVLHSREGYLWLGTYAGLVRYDGRNFRLMEGGEHASLARGGVTCLVQEREGTILAGTPGNGILRVVDGKVEPFPGSTSLPSQNVLSLFVDRSGDVWAGTDRGVARFSQGKVETFGKPHGFEEAAVRALDETANGVVWAGTDDGRLRRYEGGKWSDVFSTSERRSPATVSSLLADGDSVWMGTYAGLLKVDGDKVTRYGTAEGLSNLRVRALCKDRDGNLWVGTGGGGLGRLRGGRFDMLTAREGLENDFVRSVSEDREGNLWVGTNGALVRLRDGRFVGYADRHGLSGDFVRTVLEDRLGQIWAGTDGGGLHLASGSRFEPVGAKLRIPSRFVRALAEDEAGALWVGTADAGVARVLKGRTEVFGTGEGLPSPGVRAILCRRGGEVWVGTDRGLALFAGTRFVPVPGPDALATRIVAMLEGRDGTVWVGTYDRGLVRIGGSTAVLTEADGLAANAVFALYEDGDGVLWIGTSDGLTRMEGGRLTVYRRAQGLAAESLFSILEDVQGNLWCSSGQGVLRIRKAELTDVARGSRKSVRCALFDRRDGLPSRQCNGINQPSAWRDQSGRLWFPTARGMAVTDPAVLPRYRKAPPVRIEAVTVDGKLIPIRGGVVVGSGPHRIEIDYSVLSLGDAERAPCRFRLDGFDEEWRDGGDRRRAYYNSLSPGRYTFRVTSAIGEGAWDETGASLDMEVRPSWLESWWFRAAALALLVGLSAAAYRVRLGQMRSRALDLERIVEEKTRDLEEAKARIEEANRQLEEMLRRDLLTGVPNRLHFNEALDSEWRRGRRNAAELAVIFFDIDHFKDFNDAFGHQAGDDCLRRVAAVLSKGAQRAGQMVARWGGEEFVALLPETSLTGAATVAARLVADLDALAIPHVSPVPGSSVTISAGVAAMVPGVGRPEEVLAAADAALYEAKRLGRHRVVTSDQVSGAPA